MVSGWQVVSGIFIQKNYQNLTIGFQVTVENVGDVFLTVYLQHVVSWAKWWYCDNGTRQSGQEDWIQGYEASGLDRPGKWTNWKTRGNGLSYINNKMAIQWSKYALCSFIYYTHTHVQYVEKVGRILNICCMHEQKTHKKTLVTSG